MRSPPRLRAAYDIHLELATHATIVLVLGIGQPTEPLDRFAHDLAEAVRQIAPGSEQDRSRDFGGVLVQPPGRGVRGARGGSTGRVHGAR